MTPCFRRFSYRIYSHALCASNRTWSITFSRTARNGWPAALLLLAHYGEDGNVEPVVLHVTQKTLAEMIGVTRERINVHMNKFRKLGFIEHNSGLHIHRSLLNILLRD